MTRADQPPAEADRELLLAALARVLKELGWQRFARAPIVLPTDAFFPDAFAPDPSGVATLAGRLAAHAGLDDLSIEVVVPRSMSLEDLAMMDARSSAPELEEAPPATIWLAELQGEIARVAVEPDLLAVRSRAGMVAETARAIAAAELALAGLIEVRRAVEAREVDVAAVALGLGVIVTNAALRLRRHTESAGLAVRSRDEIDVVTALAPNELTFLLAAQHVARGDSAEDRDRIAAQLEPDQRAAFLASIALLERDALCAALDLPDPSSWPEPSEVVAAEPRVRVVVPEDARHERTPVVRIRLFRTVDHATLASIAGLFVFVVLVVVEVDAGAALAVWPVATVLGALAGRMRRADVCSRRECGARLPLGASACPGCGGTIEGECEPGKVLEAEEAIEARARSTGYRDRGQR